MLARLALAASLIGASPAFAGPEALPVTTEVVIETTMGDITVALETERAPVTAANFLRYADEDRFDGIVFYRSMKLDWDRPNGLIQAGTQYDPQRTLPPIAHEPTDATGVRHLTGTISMAREAPGTATGDWSIWLRPQPYMDADPANEDPERRAGYAAFGQVTGGWEVVLAIHAMPADPDAGVGAMKGQMLAEPVTILNVRRAQPAPAE